jgi:ATP-dependent Clp protease adaptor protein ClpS
MPQGYRERRSLWRRPLNPLYLRRISDLCQTEDHETLNFEIERSMANTIKPIDDDDNETGVATKSRPKTKKPAMYKVLMLNDDYTPMEFVVHVLERFFSKTHEEAMQIMLHVHQQGVGICGVFTYEVAETKVTQVMDLAKEHQHPLQCTIEKDGDD